MYKILKAEKLAEKIFLMDVEAPRVARSCQPGEFVIVKMDEKGERIPLTICDFDREKGTVTIVFQIVGASTLKMSELQAGDTFQDFVGPLGQPSEFVKEDIEAVKGRKYLFVAGGVGTAPVYPQVKWMKQHGIDVDVIVGAKNKELLILEDMMKAQAGNLYITTDDGNRGDQRPGREPGQAVRCVRSHRTDDHDEICMQTDQRTEYPDYRQHEPDHGRRNRYVRSMPFNRW